MLAYGTCFYSGNRQKEFFMGNEVSPEIGLKLKLSFNKSVADYLPKKQKSEHDWLTRCI